MKRHQLLPGPCVYLFNPGEVESNVTRTSNRSLVYLTELIWLVERVLLFINYLITMCIIPLVTQGC